MMWVVLSLACGDEPTSDPGTDAPDPAVDADGDGHTEGVDCNDADGQTYPGATEVWYDGVDQDCSGGSDFDQDGDGHDADDMGGLDCDDLDPAFSPDAVEVWYDGVDQNCDGGDDHDQDGDGDPTPVVGGLDCDDADAGVNSGLQLNDEPFTFVGPVAGSPAAATYTPSPLGPVGEPSEKDQHHATVAWGVDGRYAVAWQVGDGADYSALLAVFDASGARVSGPHLLNALGNGGKPDVEARSDGYVVTWEDGADIYLRATNLEGVPLSPPVLAYTRGGVTSETPDLAVFDDDGGVVVWESHGGDWGDGTHLIRRFDDRLNFIDEEPVFVEAAGRSAPDVYALADRGFVVTGTHKFTDAHMEVYAKKFGGDGCVQPFRADQAESEAPSRPAIAVDAVGRMAITWRSKVEMGVGAGSYGRFFDAQGRAMGDSFSLASVAEDGNRSVVQFWGERAVFCWQGVVDGLLPDAPCSIWDLPTGQPVVSQWQLNDDPLVDASRVAISIRDDGGGAATMAVTWEQEVASPHNVFTRLVPLTP